MFLGTVDKVYIVDKTENNPARIKGHPAWASGMSLSVFCRVRLLHVPGSHNGFNRIHSFIEYPADYGRSH